MEESFDRKNEEYVKLGKENLKYIRNAHGWCKNIRINMKSYGLLAQTTGLPIGMHSISCQYAAGGVQAMNLPWVIPDFIVKYCDGCSSLSPGDRTDWGNQIIQSRKEEQKKQETLRQLREEELKVLRERVREASKAAAKTADPQERAIFDFLAGIFCDEIGKQREQADLLVQAAKIGADVFSPSAINILLEQALSKEFATYCLPVCVELAGQRDDLAQRLKKIACAAIESDLYPELAAAILIKLGDKGKYPMPDFYIETLIRCQHYYRHIAVSYRKPLSYPNSVLLLLQCYDANPDSVIEPIRRLLKSGGNYLRVNVCGVIAVLQKERPQIGLPLLPDLIAVLDLPEESEDDNADVRIKRILAKTFYSYPLCVDNHLSKEISSRRPAIQQEIVDVYEHVLDLDIDHEAVIRRDEEESSSTANIETIDITLRRCIGLMKSDSLDLAVRHAAAEAICVACKEYPEVAVKQIDSLLGYYALICGQEQPPPSVPKIIIPGKNAIEDPILKNLENMNILQQWRFFKQTIINCLTELSKRQPKITVEIATKIYDNLETKTNAEFKAALISMLGEAGNNYDLQPVVLPLIMKALMDFESSLLRANAIQALESLYKYSSTKPPRNIIEILLIHLRDTYVIVHKYAIRLLRWHANWLDKEQAKEAFRLLLIWLDYYKREPYYLDDVADTLISVSYRYPDLKAIAIAAITSALPTKEQLVDEKIIENLLQYAKQDEKTTQFIIPQIICCLGNYSRDRYHDYDRDARCQMFKWLMGITHELYCQHKSVLLSTAHKVAKQDALEANYFASLFSLFGDYEEEGGILNIAAAALNNEKRYSKWKAEMLNISVLATINGHLKNGRFEEAEKYFPIQVTDDEES